MDTHQSLTQQAAFLPAQLVSHAALSGHVQDGVRDFLQQAQIQLPASLYVRTTNPSNSLVSGNQRILGGIKGENQQRSLH